MRFAGRLTALMAILAAASAIALALMVAHLVDQSVEERARERLQRESTLVAAQVGPILGDPTALDAAVRRAGAALRARVTVIRADGVVIADSGVERSAVASLENHGGRPEVMGARTSESGFAVRHSATLGRDLFYLAQRIDPAGDVVRLALPYDELLHIESRYEWGARLAIALVCTLLFLAGTVATRMMVRPIREVSEAALAITRGDTERMLPDHAIVEIAELSSAINRMKQSLLHATARVERERQLGAAVFETLPDGTVIVDRHWNIVEANPSFRQLLNADCRSGQQLADVIRDRELFAPFEQAVTTGTISRATVSRESDVTWQISVHPLAGDDAAAVGIIHDVTPFRQNELMRRRFVADISHELRTPVASIAAAAETLSSRRLADEDDRSLVDVVARQARRMGELLDDLTDLTMIETGQIALDRETVDLQAIAEEVATDVRPTAASRGTSVVVEGDHATIEGDRRRLAQIVRNLIDNAVKFSPDQARVSVAVAASEDEVALTVSDSGGGIPQRELPRIFQRFYQVDRSRSKLRPGSGLGLAIVKHLAQLHHATVDVHSTLGAGSTFTVRFPRVQKKQENR